MRQKFCPTCFTPFSDPKHPDKKYCSPMCNTAKRPFTSAEEEYLIERDALLIPHRVIARELNRSTHVISKVALQLQREGRMKKHAPGRKSGQAYRFEEDDFEEPEVITYTTRKCLRCTRPFDSEGKHNRICLRCKETEAWQDGPCERGSDVTTQSDRLSSIPLSIERAA